MLHLESMERLRAFVVTRSKVEDCDRKLVYKIYEIRGKKCFLTIGWWFFTEVRIISFWGQEKEKRGGGFKW